MSTSAPAKAVSESVRRFYELMPFNYHDSIETAARRLAKNPIMAYPDLDALLQGKRVGNIVEIGCGTGWAANAIALHYSKQVTAVDMTEKALERAREVSCRVGTEKQVQFVHSDLFEFNPGERFDLVMSIGVLHHTYDCRHAFRHVSQLAGDNGHLFFGLYHLYGRRAFLNMFRDIIAREGEEAALSRYADLNPDMPDETHLRSWFRDQVMHPCETQHTLEEVLEWLDEDGFELLTTSINRYGDISDRKALIAVETSYEALSERRNRVENRFFPGFFTILAKRRGRADGQVVVPK